MSKTDKINQILRFCFLSLFFFTPLLLWPQTSEVFEFNKMLFVYLLTIIISTLWLFKSIFEKKFVLKRTPLDIPLLLFFLSQLLSTILSINPYTSVWGYYSRFHGGLASTISYILLFYAFVSNIKLDKESLLDFYHTILGSALLISLYGTLEHFGIDKNLWVQDVQSRVFSTLGQPNWLSAYLVALLPLPLFLRHTTKEKHFSHIYTVTGFLFFITILFTKSQSGIGTTFIIIFLYFVIRLFQSKGVKNFFKAHSISLFLLLILLSTLIIGTPWTPNPSQISHRLDLGGPLWPEAEPYFNRLSLTTQTKPLEMEKLPQTTQDTINKRSQGIRVGGSNSFDIRRVVWQGAVNLGLKNPLFGTGVETFGYSYFTIRPATHNLLSEWEFLYNKAHNEYLNFFANSGFIGLITYLTLIISTLISFFKSIKKSKQPLLVWPLLLGYISLLITNFFGFSVVIIAVFFFLFPALIFSFSPSSNKEITLNIPPLLSDLLLVFPLLSLYLLFSLFNTFKADIAYNQGKSYSQAFNLEPALIQLEKATKLQPKQPLFLSQLAETEAKAVASLQAQIETLPATASTQLTNQAQSMIDSYTQKALDHTTQALNLNPHHTNLYKSQAKTYLYLATSKPEYTLQALNTLLELTAISPTDPKILYNIGIIYEQLGNTDKALQAYQKSLELKPDYQAVQDKFGKI